MPRNAKLLCALMSVPLGCGEAGEDAVAETPTSLDPLAMPSTPTLGLDQFNSADTCAGCHPNHYAQWQLSRHARAMRDPVYRALVELRQAEIGGDQDPFCTQCHSTLCTRSGECGSDLAFEALSPISLEGVTCEACHKVRAVVRSFNAGHELDPDGPMRGPIVEPVDAGVHAVEYSPLFDDASLCGSCHDVMSMSGMMLEQPYAEWLASPANPGQPCQRCHMPTYAGKAAVTGPERDDLHLHRFVGVDLPLEGDVDPATLAELDAEIDALLATAVAVRLELPGSVRAGGQLEFSVAVESRIAGHGFPTGSTFNRQAWIELAVRDAADRLLYASGQLDARGDLRDRWSSLAPAADLDLIRFGSHFTDADGEPVLSSWRAHEHELAVLPAMASRTFTRSLHVPADAVGPVRVEAVMHFRAYPPHLLRRLGLDELVAQVPVRDIAADAGAVELRD